MPDDPPSTHDGPQGAADDPTQQGAAGPAATAEPPAEPPVEQTADQTAGPEQPEQAPREPHRFGTFQGVYVPSILTILGVIMYLRLGWVVGEAGIVLTLLIITLATSITLVTGLSIAATATNMRVRGGGAYFMVSRSFGVESGAAIGLPLYLAQATGVSFYLAGFAESVQPLLPAVPPYLVGLAALLVLTVLAFVSANLALKTQLLILAIIVGSLVSVALGHPIAADTDAGGAAAVAAVAAPSVPFWTVFAVFFPAVTGILSGVSMSGDLKDPRRSLPFGTIAAVATGYAVYMGLAVLLWWYAPRAVLRSDPQVLWGIAILPQAMYAGIWGATLSSAMGALLGGARTLQALGQDRVVPRFLGRGSGAGNDPRLATLITFAIAAAGIYAGSLDLLAPVLSMFFLTSYGALNLIAALEGLIGNPSWRPTFNTPWRLSLAGSALCVGTMLMIDAGASLIAICACAGVYLLMRRRRLRTGWTDIRGGILLAMARLAVYKLGRYQDVARVWRPNILLFSGAPTSRWYLVELADAITHGKGFLTVATIVERDYDEEKVRGMEKSIADYLQRQAVPALVRVKYAEGYLAGVLGLVTDYGLGHIEPNTIMMGETEESERIVDYCKLLLHTCRHQKNLMLVRDSRGTSDEGLRLRESLTIDVWMTNRNNNATLMLIFAFMLQNSPEWRGAELCIKSLAPTEEAREGLEASFGEFLAESRIDARIEILPRREGTTPFEEITRHSSGADLVFLGMRAPEEDEQAEAYASYYRGLLASTRDLPLCILTLAGEQIAFKEVFS